MSGRPDSRSGRPAPAALSGAQPSSSLGGLYPGKKLALPVQLLGCRVGYLGRRATCWLTQGPRDTRQQHRRSAHGGDARGIPRRAVCLEPLAAMPGHALSIDWQASSAEPKIAALMLSREGSQPSISGSQCELGANRSDVITSPRATKPRADEHQKEPDHRQDGTCNRDRAIAEAERDHRAAQARAQRIAEVESADVDR